MRIGTWNVNGIRARFDFLRRWLSERRPDLVGLQELKVSDGEFPWAELEREGYHAAVLGQKGWNGVGVLSRTPLAVVERGLPGREAWGARFITVETAGLRYTSVYAPNGKSVGHDDFPRKLEWYDALIEHLRRQPGTGPPTILGGDLNLCPAPIDSWNDELLRGSIFHTDEERARFRALEALGFHDLFRKHAPSRREFTWWDYRAGAFHKRQGLRIDFLLGTAPVLARLEDVTIDRDWRKKKDGLIPSDHAPVVATLSAGPR
jgi:exodeoxyribonuclease-3